MQKRWSTEHLRGITALRVMKDNVLACTKFRLAFEVCVYFCFASKIIYTIFLDSYIYTLIYDTCVSSFWLHSVCHFWGPSTSLQMIQLHSFLWLRYSIVYTYHIFIYSSIEGDLGWFHILAIENKCMDTKRRNGGVGWIEIDIYILWIK